MSNTSKHIAILGLKVEDRVTGFKGIAVSVCFDLYGCIQSLVNPGIGVDGKLGEQSWFDISRLLITDEVPVMSAPDFSRGPVSDGNQGPAEKPLQNKP